MPAILIDENLSPSLRHVFSEERLSAVHVREVGLKSASDTTIWAYALDNGLAIISKDADFHQRSLVNGSPPKVIWLRMRNSSTRELSAAVGRHMSAIDAFLSDPSSAFLVLT